MGTGLKKEKPFNNRVQDKIITGKQNPWKVSVVKETDSTSANKYLNAKIREHAAKDGIFIINDKAMKLNVISHI